MTPRDEMNISAVTQVYTDYKCPHSTQLNSLTLRMTYLVTFGTPTATVMPTSCYSKQGSRRQRTSRLPPHFPSAQLTTSISGARFTKYLTIMPELRSTFLGMIHLQIVRSSQMVFTNQLNDFPKRNLQHIVRHCHNLILLQSCSNLTINRKIFCKLGPRSLSLYRVSSESWLFAWRFLSPFRNTLCEKVSLSTKPEVDNVSQRHQRRTEPLPEVRP